MATRPGESGAAKTRGARRQTSVVVSAVIVIALVAERTGAGVPAIPRRRRHLRSIPASPRSRLQPAARRPQMTETLLERRRSRPERPLQRRPAEKQIGLRQMTVRHPQSHPEHDPRITKTLRLVMADHAASSKPAKPRGRPLPPGAAVPRPDEPGPILLFARASVSRVANPPDGSPGAELNLKEPPRRRIRSLVNVTVRLGSSDASSLRSPPRRRDRIAPSVRSIRPAAERRQNNQPAAK